MKVRFGMERGELTEHYGDVGQEKEEVDEVGLAA